MIAMSGRPESRLESLRAGCEGFVSKNDPPDRLLRSARSRAGGAISVRHDTRRDVSGPPQPASGKTRHVAGHHSLHPPVSLAPVARYAGRADQEKGHPPTPEQEGSCNTSAAVSNRDGIP